MLRHGLRILIVVCVGLVLWYGSPFWVFELWERPGLLGWSALPPGGNLAMTWLRGTPFAPFSLLIWAIAMFLLTTLVQRLFDRLS
jgi:hypothetical protein